MQPHALAARAAHSSASASAGAAIATATKAGKAAAHLGGKAFDTVMTGLDANKDGRIGLSDAPGVAKKVFHTLASNNEPVDRIDSYVTLGGFGMKASEVSDAIVAKQQSDVAQTDTKYANLTAEAMVAEQALADPTEWRAALSATGAPLPPAPPPSEALRPGTLSELHQLYRDMRAARA